MADGKLYHAKFYGIPCWFLDDGQNNLAGKNRFFDRLIPLAAAIHNTFTLLAMSEAIPFPIKLIREATTEEISNLAILAGGIDALRSVQ
ncbi:MAG: hypothetical protein AAGU11_18820 [Syntrophobacteraceae bacterium]